MTIIADIDNILQVETTIGDYFSEDTYNGHASLFYENESASINIVSDSDEEIVFVALADYDTDEELKAIVIENEEDINDIPQELSSVFSYYAENSNASGLANLLKKFKKVLETNGFEADSYYEPTLL
jgi:hypothetical protein